MNKKETKRGCENMEKEVMIAEIVKYQPKAEKDIDEKIVNNKSLFERIFSKVKVLKKFYADVKILIEMIIDWRKRKYNEISKKTILILCGALIYVLFPFDIICDDIPLLGFVDDATVIGYILKNCSVEINKYRNWKKYNIDVG